MPGGPRGGHLPVSIQPAGGEIRGVLLRGVGLRILFRARTFEVIVPEVIVPEVIVPEIAALKAVVAKVIVPEAVICPGAVCKVLILGSLTLKGIFGEVNAAVLLVLLAADIICQGGILGIFADPRIFLRELLVAPENAVVLR